MAEMDTWDAEGFEPEEPGRKTAASDRWAGEDEERTVKDNWDDEEEQCAQEVKQSEVKVPEKRKKKLNDKIKQKEQKAAEERKTSALYRRKKTRQIRWHLWSEKPSWRFRSMTFRQEPA